MSTFLAPLLAFLHAAGYLALWLATFVAAAGAPMPIAPLLIAAGAFAEEGSFNLGVLVVVAVSAALAGDSVAYWAGRAWGSHLLDRLPRTPLVGRFITPVVLARTRRVFLARGGWAIILTRTVLSSLGSVTNIVAGMEGYPFGRFLLWNIVGNGIGIGAKLVLGYLVGASWQAAGEALGNLSLAALLVFAVLCAVVVGIRALPTLTRRGTSDTTFSAVDGVWRWRLKPRLRAPTAPQCPPARTPPRQMCSPTTEQELV